MAGFFAYPFFGQAILVFSGFPFKRMHPKKMFWGEEPEVISSLVICRCVDEAVEDRAHFRVPQFHPLHHFRLLELPHEVSRDPVQADPVLPRRFLLRRGLYQNRHVGSIDEGRLE